MFQAEKDHDKSIFADCKMLDPDDLFHKRFEQVGSHFVDSSGWGQKGEPALTAEQFLKKIQKGKFYAIIECGQFQVNIGKYVKKNNHG